MKSLCWVFRSWVFFVSWIEIWYNVQGFWDVIDTVSHPKSLVC